MKIFLAIVVTVVLVLIIATVVRVEMVLRDVKKHLDDITGDVESLDEDNIGVERTDYDER